MSEQVVQKERPVLRWRILAMPEGLGHMGRFPGCERTGDGQREAEDRCKQGPNRVSKGASSDRARVAELADARD